MKHRKAEEILEIAALGDDDDELYSLLGARGDS